MESFIKKFGVFIFVIFLLGWILIGSMYEIESKKHLIFSIKYLSIPIFFVTTYLFLNKLPKFRNKQGNFNGIVIVFIYTIIIIFMSANYILLYNSYFGTQFSTQIEGEIIRLNHNSSTLPGFFSRVIKFSEYSVTIENKESRQIIELDISKEHFKRLKKGQMFSEPWIIGSLNLLYKRV